MQPKKITTTRGKRLPVKKKPTTLRATTSSMTAIPPTVPATSSTKTIKNSDSNIKKHTAPTDIFDRVWSNGSPTQEDINALGNLRKERGQNEVFTNTILRETDLRNVKYGSTGTIYKQNGQDWTKYVSDDKVDYIKMKWDNYNWKWKAEKKTNTGHLTT